ncbi:MAG TPA: redoxin domain-containing protein [Saprospiraceae bacterium]
MRNILLTFIILFTSLHLQAQQAPDFTVTDIEGEVHHLYADYLNQGKTVMIKIFFTTCPPCNSIAPLMEPFYQEWGAGEYDVEFFEMTDKTFDVNSLVEAYAQNYNETFPAISMEGGSITAVQPYKSGQFGQWFGTPTFIVIAPDGSVQFDVSGNGNQGTIDAVDAAIAATGALKPGQTPLAPNFTITDNNGQPHNLYNDYLDQGKTVVLEIFNTACSPCNSIAPLLQPLNENWGGGSGDVVFLELSDLVTDNNTALFDYQEDYNHTFPGISNEGGSVAAVQPYKNGTYGPWVSAPTFVVIDPDGSVNYDVRGANNQATIDSIEAAIIATGATQPNPPTVAPDFTVTDIDGQVHHLYADYLNQGKSVLLEVFYTTCPPCNSIAPLMEPFYQEWGAGDHDVEFFLLTDKNSDNTTLVNAYHQTYNETFIAVSKDGGSLDAVQPYKNGSFGPWSGTPTFVVIAPDGTVQHDVDGPNNQATIDAINAALLATGAEKPNSENPVSVAGQVQFLNGSAGVNGALVQILDGNDVVIDQQTSDVNGGFTFQVLESEVQPDWKVKVVKDGNPTNGVSAIDLILIQKHLLFVEPLTNPLSKIAADANTSQTLSSLDIVSLLKLLLGISTNFPNQQTWITFPADTDFGTPTQHPPLIPSYTIPLSDILNGTRQPVFIAVKKGDVNGNANPN